MPIPPKDASVTLALTRDVPDIHPAFLISGIQLRPDLTCRKSGWILKKARYPARYQANWKVTIIISKFSNKKMLFS
jgi:hypothetical protein